MARLLIFYPRHGLRDSEAFVAKAIQETLAGLGERPRFVLLAPDEDATGWRYILYVEGAVPGNLAEALDRSLRENPNYALCRALGQLQSVRVYSIAGRGYETFAGRLVSEGRRLGDIKPVALCNKAGWSETFSKACASLEPEFRSGGRRRSCDATSQ